MRIESASVGVRFEEQKYADLFSDAECRSTMKITFIQALYLCIDLTAAAP
jgi:hypothetical protein